MVPRIEFECLGNYITSWMADGNCAIRCPSSYTDLIDTESLNIFIERHGGYHGTTDYLLDCYRKAWGYV